MLALLAQSRCSLCSLCWLLLVLAHRGGADEERYARSGVPVGEGARRREAAVRLGRQCVDIKDPTECKSWADAGECRSNAAYMHRYCSFSCDYCEDSPSIVFMEESAFGKIFVVDEGNARHLRFDQWRGDDQSTMNLTDLDATPMEYIRFASLLGTAFGISPPSRVLAVGLGGGGFVTTIHTAVPNAVVEAVDVDATVVHVAREHFGLRRFEADPNSRVQLNVDDGSAYLKRQGAAVFDSIFVDCYVAGVPSDRSDIPEHIISDTFFELLRSRLRLLGMAVINVAENDADVEMGIVSRFSQAFGTPPLSPVPSNVDSCSSVGTSKPLSTWGRARLGHVLTAMRAADGSNGWNWAADLARTFVDDDGPEPSTEDQTPGLVAWLGARLKPFAGTGVELGWTSHKGQAIADSDSLPLCGYLTAEELERILLVEDNEQSETSSCSVSALLRAGRATGCLALLTPESTNLLLVGQA
eukprot:COSAG02_NODE_1155_length_14189_cov_8.424060_7_plen_471_part_00